MMARSAAAPPQFDRVLVQRALCYILISRYGMETQELIGLLHCSQAAWSTFYLAAADSLHEVEGCLTISSHVLRLAVTRRYLHDPSMRVLVHQDLIRFFQQPLDETISGARRMQACMHTRMYAQ